MHSFYKISSAYGKNKGIFELNYHKFILLNIDNTRVVSTNDPETSRYWFFIILLIYLVIYSRLYRLTKINLIYKSTIK